MKRINEKLIDKLKIALKIIFIVIIFILIGVVYIFTKNTQLTLIVGVLAIILLLLILLYDKITKIYLENIFVQLSDMLDTIINLKDENIFSTTEDTMLSKLQYQTIKLTDILKAKNRRIENDRNEIKSLISDIAHQLKTPLTNLKMYGELLNDKSLSEDERNEFFQVILSSLDRLTFLVESMIKMSRLESGVIQIRAKKNNLNDLILTVIGQVQRKAKDKNIVIKLLEKNKIEINCDKRWISEALLNILDNAVKYTGINGEIEIVVQSYDMFSRIDIKDNGIGIAEEELPKIFSRFYRGKNTMEIEGIGIGLYLAREIITKHNGYIKVDSSSEGTMFSVFLTNK